MADIIVDKSQEEHEKLLDLIDEISQGLSSLSRDIQWGDSTWLPDEEFLKHIARQVISLHNVKESVLSGHYREAYNDIRMVFEFYLLLTLMSICDRYTATYKIRKASGDANIDQAKTRFKQEINQAISCGHPPGILRIAQETADTVTIVRRGIFVTEDGHFTGLVVPIYHYFWHNYTPQHHLNKQSLHTNHFLPQPWALSRSKRGRPVNTESKELYRRYFTFDGLVNNLRLNRVLNTKTATRVIVHYNFLSGYSHSTNDALRTLPFSSGFSSLSQVYRDSCAYDHYHSELCLLYILHLLGMHLSLVFRYFRRHRIKIRNGTKLYRVLINKANTQFGYFWFIYNTPHEYDRFVTANRKSNPQKGIRFATAQIRPNNTRYYEDPLERLRKLHTSQHELTSGNVFQSPFLRTDARYA